METLIFDLAGAVGDLTRELGQGLAGMADAVQVQPPPPDAAPALPVGREGLPSLPGGGGGTSGLDLLNADRPGGAGAAVPAAKLDPVSLFLQADWVVKGVMLMLVLASFWSWAIIIDKLWRLKSLFRRADTFEDRFWSGGSLDDLYDRMGHGPRDPMSKVFIAAMREWRRATGRSGNGGSLSASLSQRIDRVMQITMSRELDDLERRLGFLASTGSVAPFVGLFGTVWGIMNSFHAIGMSKDTSLATVAPGIAEALFATAIGLVAAIPAVVAYNKLSNDIDRYARRLETFSGEFGAILSRQIEDRASPRGEDGGHVGHPGTRPAQDV
ncbi:protein TolQ [Roseospira visakhapatnamensis]|uniref:Tol-Pal system protein TolQ n=1 Tax=Roseospira visakhapatnamensis TaxID=390880 RepID=A0A7W6RBS4_9PROT|nr:biopolymer transport protein TolQ [Roseospira visakhapatnamensis]